MNRDLQYQGVVQETVSSLNQLLILEANISKHASVFRCCINIIQSTTKSATGLPGIQNCFQEFHVRLEGPILSFIMQVAIMQVAGHPNRKDLSTTSTFTLSTRRKKPTFSKLQMVVEEKEVWSRKAENGLMLVSELDMIRSFLFGDQLTAIFLAFLACALFLCDLLLFPFSDLAGPERARTLDQMNHCG